MVHCVCIGGVRRNWCLSIPIIDVWGVFACVHCIIERIVIIGVFNSWRDVAVSLLLLLEIVRTNNFNTKIGKIETF